MTSSFNIAVLGPIPRDFISTHKNEIVEKYGCVLYPTVVLSTLLGEGSRIVPVVHVRQSDLQPITDILSPFQSVDTTHIVASSDQGDIISLNYLTQSKREERQTGFMSPIVPDDVNDLSEFDAFVFVPITDFEIALSTLAYIKSRSKGIVVFDAHGPTNGCSRRSSWLVFRPV